MAAPRVEVAETCAITPRRPLGKLVLFAVLFAGGLIGAIVDAALHNFRSGAGTMGVTVGIGLTYGILHGMNLVGKKQSS